MNGELNLTRKLEGGTSFNGRKGGLITEKQCNIIDFIYQELKIPFRGTNSKQAYAFINTYYEKAKSHRAKRLKNNY